MALVDWINPFNKVADIVSEAVTDKDKKNELNAALKELEQKVYMQELSTKTVPWVDAIHKLGRQIIALTTVCLPALLLYLNPEMDISKIMLVVGGGSVPGALYTAMKGKGK